MDKILCIDDDPVTLMYCTGLINKTALAMEVLRAVGGQKAIEYYETLFRTSEREESNYPELIFLDLNMPIMNGWEFLDEFMARYYPIFPKTKVVILTSSIDPTDQERAKKYSIVMDFLSKPLTIQMLQRIQEDAES